MPKRSKSKQFSENDNQDVCNYCKDGNYSLTNHHKATLEHRFNFKIGSLQKYRKALAKNRHGIEVKIVVEKKDYVDLRFELQPKQGNYLTKINREQLALNDNQIIYRCSIKNISKTNKIYIITANLLHSSTIFKIEYDERYAFGFRENAVILLEPGSVYNCKILFQSSEFCGSFKIPFTVDLQTCEDDKTEEEFFTICRSFIVADLGEMSEEGLTRSPFTCKPFEEVDLWIEPTCSAPRNDRYTIPDQYKKNLMFGLEPSRNMSDLDINALAEIKNKLENQKSVTESNYQNFWHVVLWLEEMAETLMLTKYNMENIEKNVKNNILEVFVPGLAERRPSIIVGDTICVKIQGDYKAYKGVVRRVKDKSVDVFNLEPELFVALSDNPDIELDVKFVLSRLSLERCHEGVTRLGATGMVKKLFPTVQTPSVIKYQLSDNEFYNQEIVDNAEQRTAVIQILNHQQSAPYIVFGPPGTGKTITIVEAILQIKNKTNKRILVCAPANSACDMIASKLMKHCSRKELIRIHSETRDSSTLSNEEKRYSNITDGATYRKIAMDELMSYRVIVTTLILIGKFKQFKTDYVFIDEAAQASEPESVIAVSFGKHIVLAGDHKQLGPMVNSRCAEKEYKLGISLMERLMEMTVYKPDRLNKYNKDLITMLILNFRSHGDILKIPNQIFYSNNLKAVSGMAQRDPLVNIAIHPKIFGSKKNRVGKAIEFCSVSAKEKREGNSPSYFNFDEVKMVVNYVTALLNLPLDAHAVKQSQIGIVTPYKRQVFKIKEKLKHNGFGDVEVGTTESYQGREKRVIIISTVRAQHSLLKHDKKYNLGFVKHDKRFNVALTRAMSKLIVIGCQYVLSTDKKWQKLIEMCIENGTYFGARYVERNSRFKEEVVTRTKNFRGEDGQYKKNNRHT